MVLPGFLYCTIKYKANTTENVNKAVHHEIKNITSTQRIAPARLSHML